MLHPCSQCARVAALRPDESLLDVVDKEHRQQGKIVRKIRILVWPVQNIKCCFATGIPAPMSHGSETVVLCYY